MKNLYLLFIAFVTLTITNAQTYQVTFEVNTEAIVGLGGEVGPNGMYLGGGIFGNATAHQMSDADGDGTWSVTVPIDAGTTGYYIFLNSPNHGDDWGKKENLSNDCSDPNNYNDRPLPAITGDMTIQHCFGTCDTGGVCTAPATPANAITSYSASFDTDADVFVSADGASVAHDANGYLVFSGVSAGPYAHLRANVNPMNLTSGDRGISLRVKGQRASKVFLKLQDGDNYANNWENEPTENNYTDVGNWQTLTWDMSAWDSSWKTYMSAIVFFFDITAAADADPANDTFWVDDFQFGEFATLSTSKISISDVSIYPNPAKDILNISAGEKIDSATIFDLTGRIVKISNPYKEVFNFNISDLSNGVYLVKLNAGDKESTIKFIKQ